MDFPDVRKNAAQNSVETKSSKREWIKRQQRTAKMVQSARKSNHCTIAVRCLSNSDTICTTVETGSALVPEQLAADPNHQLRN